MGLRLYGCMESFYWGYPGSIGAFFFLRNDLTVLAFGAYYLGPKTFFLFFFFSARGTKKCFVQGGRREDRWWGRGR